MHSTALCSHCANTGILLGMKDIGKTLLRQRVKQVNKSELNFFWALDPS